MQNVNALRAALQSNVCNVTFRKLDGTVRNMRATTDATRFSYESKTNVERKRNDNVCVMWDMDKQQWRSMRNDALIEWAVEA